MSLPLEAKPAYEAAFLPVSKFREVTGSQEAAEEKKQTNKNLVIHRGTQFLNHWGKIKHN